LDDPLNYQYYQFVGIVYEGHGPDDSDDTMYGSDMIFIAGFALWGKRLDEMLSTIHP